LTRPRRLLPVAKYSKPEASPPRAFLSIGSRCVVACRSAGLVGDRSWPSFAGLRWARGGRWARLDFAGVRRIICTRRARFAAAYDGLARLCRSYAMSRVDGADRIVCCQLGLWPSEKLGCPAGGTPFVVCQGRPASYRLAPSCSPGCSRNFPAAIIVSSSNLAGPSSPVSTSSNSNTSCSRMTSSAPRRTSFAPA